MTNLSDRLALITGSARGIGPASSVARISGHAASLVALLPNSDEQACAQARTSVATRRQAAQ